MSVLEIESPSLSVPWHYPTVYQSVTIVEQRDANLSRATARGLHAT